MRGPRDVKQTRSGASPSADANAVRILAGVDPTKLSLSPELVKGACGLLNWAPGDLARRAGVELQMLVQFLDFGVILDWRRTASIKAALLEKVEFVSLGGAPGVCRRPHVGRERGPASIQFGGPVDRRPPL